mgnify:CR=1 FL=1
MSFFSRRLTRASRIFVPSGPCRATLASDSDDEGEEEGEEVEFRCHSCNKLFVGFEGRDPEVDVEDNNGDTWAWYETEDLLPFLRCSTCVEEICDEFDAFFAAPALWNTFTVEAPNDDDNWTEEVMDKLKQYETEPGSGVLNSFYVTRTLFASGSFEWMSGTRVLCEGKEITLEEVKDIIEGELPSEWPYILGDVGETMEIRIFKQAGECAAWGAKTKQFEALLSDRPDR